MDSELAVTSPSTVPFSDDVWEDLRNVNALELAGWIAAARATPGS